jgi:hypothetical protein
MTCSNLELSAPSLPLINKCIVVTIELQVHMIGLLNINLNLSQRHFELLFKTFLPGLKLASQILNLCQILVLLMFGLICVLLHLLSCLLLHLDKC